MKLKYTIITTALALTVASCASTSTTTDTAMVDNTVVQESVKKETTKKSSKKLKGIIFVTENDADTTRAAIVSALKLNGFNVDATAKSMVISGARPHKMGLLAGSGGEKIRVKMSESSATETTVHVRTKKTLFGYAVQKNWDDEVTDAVKAKLAE